MPTGVFWAEYFCLVRLDVGIIFLNIAILFVKSFQRRYKTKDDVKTSVQKYSSEPQIRTVSDSYKLDIEVILRDFYVH